MKIVIRYILQVVCAIGGALGSAVPAMNAWEKIIEIVVPEFLNFYMATGVVLQMLGVGYLIWLFFDWLFTIDI